MSIAVRVKEGGAVLLGFAILVGMMAIGVALLIGAAKFSMWVLEWTFPAFGWTTLLSLVVLGPLALIPQSRGWSAIGFMAASLVFGAILWLWGMAITYTTWGIGAVLIGLFLFGIGVVPVAMLAAVVDGEWGTFGILIFAAVLTFGSRMLAQWLAEKADERTARLSGREITVEAYKVPE